MSLFKAGSRIPNIPYYQTLRDWPEDGSRNVKDFINVRYQNSLATPSKEIEEKVQRKDQSKFLLTPETVDSAYSGHLGTSLKWPQ